MNKSHYAMVDMDLKQLISDDDIQSGEEDYVVGRSQ